MEIHNSILPPAVSETASRWLNDLTELSETADNLPEVCHLVSTKTLSEIQNHEQVDVPDKLEWRRGAWLMQEVEGALWIVGSQPIGILFAIAELESLVRSGAELKGLHYWREPRFGLRINGRDELYLDPQNAWLRKPFLEAIVRYGFDTAEIPWYAFRSEHVDKTLVGLEQLEAYDLDASIEFELFQHIENVPDEAKGVSRLSSGVVEYPVCVRKEWTKHYFRQYLKRIVDHPRIKLIFIYFFDVSHFCSDECPCCGDTPVIDRIMEFTAWCQSIVDETRSDLRVYLRTWHVMLDERWRINEALPQRIGVDTKLATGGDEIYSTIPKYSDHYGPAEQELIRRYSERTVAEVSIGNCESIDSAAGIPLMKLTAKRFNDLASWGGAGIRNWWGYTLGHYNPNYELVRELFFDPLDRVEGLMNKIAVRDFGPKQAPQVIHFWKQAEKTVTQWPIVSWMQRFEVFKDRAYGVVSKPCLIPIRPEAFESLLLNRSTLIPTSCDFDRLVPRELESEGQFKEHPLDWIDEHLLKQHEVIIHELDSILTDGQQIEAALSGEAGQRMSHQNHSLGYFRVLLHSQYAFFKALWLTQTKKDAKIIRDQFHCDQQMAELVEMEIANNQRFIDLIKSEPCEAMAHFDIDGKRPFQQDRPLLPGQLKVIEQKLDSMKAWKQIWESGASAGIPYAPFISIDRNLYQWGDPRLNEVKFNKQTKLGLWPSREAADWAFKTRA